MAGFGTGVSLQVSMDKALSIEERALAREEAMRQREAKAREQEAAKNEGRSDKFINDINIDPAKVHRVLQDDAKQNFNNYLTKLDEMKRLHPHNYMNYMTDARVEAERNQANIVKRTQDLYALEKIPREQLTEPQQAYIEKLRIGKKADLIGINDPMGSITVNDDGEANFKYILGSKPDFQDKTIKLLNHISDSNKAQLDQISSLPNTAGKLNFLEGKFVPETETDARAAEAKIKAETGQVVSLMSKEKALKTQFAGDPSLQAWWGELNRDRYVTDKSIDWKNGNGVAERMANDYIEEAKRYGGQTFKSRVIAPIKPTQPRRETESERSRKVEVSGNTYKLGNNIWTVSTTPDGSGELYTLSKVDATENKEFELKGFKKGQIVFGTPLQIRRTPKHGVNIEVGIGHKDSDGKFVKREFVPYNTENADKIRNEFGAYIDDVKKAVGDKGTAMDGSQKTSDFKKTSTTLTTRQQSALEAFKSKMNREPSAAEYEKLLAKYK